MPPSRKEIDGPLGDSVNPRVGRLRERVKEALGNSNLTLQRVENDLGYAGGLVSKILGGKANFYVSELLAFAEMANVSVSELLGETAVQAPKSSLTKEQRREVYEILNEALVRNGVIPGPSTEGEAGASEEHLPQGSRQTGSVRRLADRQGT
jgi:hypothetical protein